MIFKADLTKQAQEVIFSRKNKKLLHPTLLFNNITLSNSLFQKQLGLTLDRKLNFSKLYQNKIRKTTVLLREFQQIPQRSSLLAIYKTFIRSRLDYADIIYAYNSTFHEKLKSVQ